jgi:hypothetical protein
VIAVEAKPSTAPILLERCPVHGSLVAYDGDGHLLGRCDGCCREAALAFRRLAHMPKRNQCPPPDLEGA